MLYVSSLGSLPARPAAVEQVLAGFVASQVRYTVHDLDQEPTQVRTIASRSRRRSCGVIRRHACGCSAASAIRKSCRILSGVRRRPPGNYQNVEFRIQNSGVRIQNIKPMIYGAASRRRWLIKGLNCGLWLLNSGLIQQAPVASIPARR